MHSTSLFYLAALALALSASVSASPISPATAVSAEATLVEDTHPHLERRQINPISFGVGTAAVDKARQNTKLADELHDQIHQLQGTVRQLINTQRHLDSTGQARLVRRQLGTVLGAVGIHKSKDTRKKIAEMEGEVAHLRKDVDGLLRAEHFEVALEAGEMHEQQHAMAEEAQHVEEAVAAEEEGPVEQGGDIDESAAEAVEPAPAHRLERRFLGIILSPIAMDKARKDRASLENLRTEVQRLYQDCQRVRTRQDARLRAIEAARHGQPILHPGGPHIDQTPLGPVAHNAGFAAPVTGGFAAPVTGGFAAPVTGGPLLATGGGPFLEDESGVMGTHEVRPAVHSRPFPHPIPPPRHSAYGGGHAPDHHHRDTYHGGHAPDHHHRDTYHGGHAPDHHHRDTYHGGHAPVHHDRY